MISWGAVRRVSRLCVLALVLLSASVLCPLLTGVFRDRTVRFWCRLLAAAVGLRTRKVGAEAPEGSLVASNHLGYLDILVLGSHLPVRFLAKSEIAAWPIIGFLSRWSDQVFVERERPRSVALLLEAVAGRLRAGQRVLLFPEAGVSSDGLNLAEFRPMIFQASIDAGRPVVPVAVRYASPADRRVWAWIEEPSLWRHARDRVLPLAGGICAELRVGEALWPEAGESRKELAARTKEAIALLLGASVADH